MQEYSNLLTDVFSIGLKLLHQFVSITNFSIQNVETRMHYLNTLHSDFDKALI